MNPCCCFWWELDACTCYWENSRDSLVLLASIFVVLGISLYQRQKTEHALEALRDLSSPRALVIRDGKEQRIAGREVVRGDFVVLSEGDRVPRAGLCTRA